MNNPDSYRENRTYMKNRYYLLGVLCCLTYASLFAQYTIDDAYTLESAINKKDEKAFYQTVLKHTPAFDNTKRLRTYLDKNPYLRNAVKDMPVDDKTLQTYHRTASSNKKVRWQFKTQEERFKQVRNLKSKKAVNYSNSQRYSNQRSSATDRFITTASSVGYRGSGGGGLNTQNIAAGITDFIIERAQEEVSNAFLQTFKRKMHNTEEYPELQKLFPSTKEFLNDNDLSTSGPMIQMARSSFHKDMTQLSINVPKLLRLTKYKEQQHSEKVIVMTMLYEVLDMVNKGLEPDDIVVISEDKLHWQIYVLEKNNKQNYIDALKENDAMRKQLIGMIKTIAKEKKEITDALQKLNVFQSGYKNEVGSSDDFNPYEDLESIFIDGCEFISKRSSAKSVYNVIFNMEKALYELEQSIQKSEQLDLFKGKNETILKDAKKAHKKLSKWSPIKNLLETHDKFQIQNTSNIIGKNIAKLDRIVHALNYSSFILYSFIDSNPKEHFASRPKIDSLFEEDDRRRYFMGLIYQKFANDIPVKNLEVYVDRYYVLIDELQMQKAYVRQRKLNPENQFRSASKDRYLPSVKTTFDLLTTGLSVEVEGDTTLLATSEVKELENLTDQTYSLSYNTQQEDHNSSVYNASVLMDYMLEEQKNQKEYRKFKRDFIDYGMFIANVLKARSPAQIKQAIRMVALPPGSSRTKKESSFNISVNSYLGLYAGQEVLTLASIDDPIRPSFGLTVPIGIAISAGMKQSGSLSLFFPIFDMGSVAAFRIGSDSRLNVPPFSIENIAAPGAYLVYGFPHYPFSIGAGVQYGPQLRKITRNNVQIESSAYRFGVSVTIDVPLFNLYTKY